MRKVILLLIVMVFAFPSNAQMVHEKGTVHIEINASVGLSPDSEFEGEYTSVGMHAGVELALMYNVTDWFAAGIGLGIGEHLYAETYSEDYDNVLTVPAMFKTKFTPGNGKVGFVARIDAGIEFIPETATQADDKLFIAHPQIGVGFHGLNSSFNLLGGIRSTFVEDNSVDYVTFGIGWAF